LKTAHRSVYDKLDLPQSPGNPPKRKGIAEYFEEIKQVSRLNLGGTNQNYQNLIKLIISALIGIYTM